MNRSGLDRTAYLKIKETVDRIRTTETAVTQGVENLRLNEERYRESVGTATDVIDAETLLTRTRVNYWTAVYDHQMAKAEMLWAIGGINELLPEQPTTQVPKNPLHLRITLLVAFMIDGSYPGLEFFDSCTLLLCMTAAT
jgi:hypothetical protein